ncbi:MULTISPECIES: putative holin [unclassified Mycobacterium]|uniref:putative holin n=1 Tax=unclassified Mycobacterium TaxID=2642494 RepID=UPI0009DBF082|nr:MULTISPECIES: putative holin [unclassified Mycobacterium]
MIPLPRPWLLSSAMLVGVAVGILAGIGLSLVITTPLRPDVAITLVLGAPSIAGLVLVFVSSRRWVVALGAFLLAMAVGWFGALAAIQVVSGV